jgi:hypothetical protein
MKEQNPLPQGERERTADTETATLLPMYDKKPLDHAAGFR